MSEAVEWLARALGSTFRWQIEEQRSRDHRYGERQCTAVDFAGRSWVFSWSTADLDPSDWGARTS